MSSYATVHDVQRALPQVKLDNSSRPNLDEVQGMLDAVEAEVNSVLVTLGYETPVIGVLSKRILKDMVVQETVSRVLQAQMVGVRDPDDLGAGRAHALYMERLRALADPNNPFTLPDAIYAERVEKILPEMSSVFGSGTEGDDDSDRRITRTMIF